MMVPDQYLFLNLIFSNLFIIRRNTSNTNITYRERETNQISMILNQNVSNDILPSFLNGA